MDFSQAYQQIENSVVMVQTGVPAGNLFNTMGVGTGVIVLDGKQVLTCAHCVNSQIGHCTVVQIPGTQNLQLARIKFIDIQLDIALLEVDVFLGPPASIISSNNMRVGMECFVVGHPNSIMQKTFLSGHVATIAPQHLVLDCSVNHGNSGGPLFDINGNVVGIVNAKHGGIDAMLENLLNSNLGASGVFINGVDPNAVFREILIGMKKNLNLGIGYAIKTEEIKNLIQNIY